MPIYMDRHDFAGVTAKDVAAAHQEDLKIQEKYGCRGLTYWFDEERQVAFCLIEAPDKEAVKNMHAEAHGLVPFEVIEVENDIVKAFLGKIEQPQSLDNWDHMVYDEPAFRTIMAAEIRDAALLSSKIDHEEAQVHLCLQKDIIRKALITNNGKEIQHNGYGFLASFTSASEAVSCSIEIQERINERSNKTSAYPQALNLGLSAGTPVNNSSTFFGQAIKTANRLSQIPSAGSIVISSVVRNLLKQEEVNALCKNQFVRTISLPEENFLNQLFDVIDTVWNDSGFTINRFSTEMGMSRSQLYRKLIALMGYSPLDFLKEVRLNKALNIIVRQEGTISEVAYQTGFTSPSYFSKCFLKRFNILPSTYATSVATFSLS